MERHSRKTLEDNLSLMAVKEGEIAGVVLNGITRKGDNEKAQDTLKQIGDERFKKIFLLLTEQNINADLFNKLNVEIMFDIRILSVDQK